MVERPILFTGEMVKAILAGTKTMTRRLVRIDDTPIVSSGNQRGIPSDARNVRFTAGIYLKCDAPDGSMTVSSRVECPYGAPGDRLFVRENAWIWCDRVAVGSTKTGRRKFRYFPIQCAGSVVYCADGAEKPTHPLDDDLFHMWRFKVGRFLPHWATRIALEVTAVRAERLHDITEVDARAEGVPLDIPADRCRNVRAEFGALWDRINEERAAWASNPWAWVVSFKRAEVARG